MRKKKATPTTGNDTLAGTTGPDAIDGLAGNDTISTGKGNDILIGNLGADKLNGGAGADIFRYLAAADSASASGKWSKATGDTILGFKPGADKIDLSALGPLTFGAAGAKKGVWAEVAGSTTYVHADTSGDGVADLSIKLAGKKVPGAGDFMLASAIPPVGTVTVSVAGDGILSVGEVTAGKVAVSGVATGDAKAGDTVTLTVNAVTYTAKLGADLKYSVDVALADLQADADKTIEAKLAVTSPTGLAGTIEGKGTFSVDPAKPVITFATTQINENTTAVDKASANMPVTWALSGADKDFFNLGTDGTVTFKTAPDYENPTHASTYNIVLTATNAFGVSDSKALAINVKDVAEPPVVTGIVAKDAAGTAYTAASDVTLGIGDVVHLFVTFDKAVTVTGAPKLILNVANGNGFATAALDSQSGSGTNTLHFVYSVADSQSSNLLDLKATGFETTATDTISAQGVTAVLPDAAGDPPGTIVIDGVTPGLPGITVTSAHKSIDAGAFFATTDKTPNLSFTADPDVVTIQLFDGATKLADITKVGGTFTFAAAADWTDGSYTLKARSIDKAGNVSGDQTITLLIDTLAPDAPTLAMTGIEGNNPSTSGAIGNGGFSTDDLPLFAGTADANAKVSLKITTNGSDNYYNVVGKTYDVTADSLGNWQADLQVLDAQKGFSAPSGSVYTVSATTVDLAGNVSTAATRTLTYWYSNDPVTKTFSNVSDWVSGSSGVDNLDGSGGNDYLRGGASADTIHGGLGDDKIYGDEALDFLFGDGGDDTLFAGLGGAEMTGGTGKDTMFGDNAAADKFIFSGGDSSVTDLNQMDEIWNFAQGTDKIVVNIGAIIGNGKLGTAADTLDGFVADAENAFATITNANFYVVYNFRGLGYSLLAFDLDNDDQLRDADDVIIRLEGITTPVLQSSDFM